MIGSGFVEIEAPHVTASSRQWNGSKVDAERNPQLAAGSYARGATRFELSVEADWLLANLDRTSILIGQIEAPPVLHVGLIPRNADSDSYRDLLRSRPNNAEASTEDEELSACYLDGVGHEQDRSEGRRVELEIRLVHGEDTTGSARSSRWRVL